MTDQKTEKAAVSLNDFIRENAASNLNSQFGMVSPRILRIDVDGGVFMSLGAAIAYYGDLKFRRLPELKTRSLKTIALREFSPLVRVEGKGQLFCARQAGHLRTIRLAGESFNISSPELVAFEESLSFEMFNVRGGISALSKGLFGIRLSGEGRLAFAVHGEPLVLPVTPGKPVNTDPHATAAWTEGLVPALKTDLTWGSIFKHGGGEAFQMHFEGDGHVVVQPSEDPAKFKLKKLKL